MAGRMGLWEATGSSLLRETMLGMSGYGALAEFTGAEGEEKRGWKWTRIGLGFVAAGESGGPGGRSGGGSGGKTGGGSG